ncbi:protein of unknown function DUF81 [Acidimicrobium ferrooxidans DSM 10331]|uniref:Probable membrane transporter protein n=1 Tax=Acidimicrobium ferrooxidans (strain DSM 10331 / JCM 15462 / NBRC 103882 / ICP) TaxID=525909 RepID=C7M0T0_ACIFD|nr:sulfite exporter TauE/SafE family protein [Acidimicrobium ferrooxidans]ACU54588.1 protein of unknown function DUF81 [Acidimicrobium ferrooxidans DSM 10331]
MMVITPLVFIIALIVIAAVAGLLGSLVGLGGGIVVVPVLTLVFHVDIRLAVGASLVTVVATSATGASRLVRRGMVNVRLALYLAIATTLGAIVGALLSRAVPTRFLFLLFAAILVYSAVAMLRRRSGDRIEQPRDDRIADALQLHGAAPIGDGGVLVAHRVERSLLGLVLMFGAGVVSALLGIGSGALNVPTMDMLMGVPLKVASATSSFMIGMTAAASAAIYLSRGQIDPILAGPIAVGVLGGATLGARLLTRVNVTVVRWVFIAVLVVVAVEMLQKGIG